MKYLAPLLFALSAAVAAAAPPALVRLAEAIRQILPIGYTVVVDDKEAMVHIGSDARLSIGISAVPFMPIEEWRRLDAEFQEAKKEWTALCAEVERIPKKGEEYAPRDDHERDLLTQKIDFWKKHRLPKYPDAFFEDVSLSFVTAGPIPDPPLEKKEEFEKVSKRIWALVGHYKKEEANQPLQGTPGTVPSSSTEPEPRRP